MSPISVLIIGAQRGLGTALTKRYGELVGSSGKVFATSEKPVDPEQSSKFAKNTTVIDNVDCTQPDCGEKVVAGLKGEKVDLVLYVSGVVIPEQFEELDWHGQMKQYQICSIAPVFVIQKLVTSNSLAPQAKIAILTSEAGCITLRTESEGGSAYGHHGSKAAGNMIGHLLSYNLKEKGHPIVMINPGMMKSDMTKAMGLQEMYPKMNAMEPEEAAVPFTEFMEKVDMSMTGKLWAINGTQGIGGAEEAMGKEWAEKSGPLALPW